MIGTWLMVSAISSALVLYGVRKKKSIWWGLFAGAISIAFIGLAGLVVGLRLYTDNLIGGFGIIFGPLWTLGVLMLMILLPVWYFAKRKSFRS
jgi:ABC-type uncharacterized transport system permease subunit